MSAVQQLFQESVASWFGIAPEVVESVIPPDDTTLFTTAGMQRYKSKFLEPDNTLASTVQSCMRTDDLELVGDGSHLTLFLMLGTFSFGRGDYAEHCKFWLHFLEKLLDTSELEIHCHPRAPHGSLWKYLGFKPTYDTSCEWSSGDIGGYCSEVFYRGVELGNLVNTLHHSTDVGFGLERLQQIVEGEARADESTLFDKSLDPISRDHIRALAVLYGCGIEPGNKKRNYVTRRLLRGLLLRNPQDRLKDLVFYPWVPTELTRREEALQAARRSWRRHQGKPVEFWWDSFGILPEEIERINQVS